jgi:hypothetical protein
MHKAQMRRTCATCCCAVCCCCATTSSSTRCSVSPLEELAASVVVHGLCACIELPAGVARRLAGAQHSGTATVAGGTAICHCCCCCSLRLAKGSTAWVTCRTKQIVQAAVHSMLHQFYKTMRRKVAVVYMWIGCGDDARHSGKTDRCCSFAALGTAQPQYSQRACVGAQQMLD